MTNIELNEQQATFLREYLLMEIENKNLSQFSKHIMLQIAEKLVEVKYE